MIRSKTARAVALALLVAPIYASAAMGEGPCEYAESAQLLASDGLPHDRFGTSVAVDGDTAIVGAPYDDGLGSSAGCAFIYRFNGSAWVEEQKLTASDGAAQDEFGFSVGIHGDLAIVGAYRHDDPVDDAGAAYIFRFNGSSWAQKQKLTAFNGDAHDWFGVSVAINGEKAIVGMTHDDDLALDAGTAYIFGLLGSTWIQEMELNPSDAALGDQFGRSVSIDGPVAIVGAFLEDDQGSNAGAAYIFRFDGAFWNEEQKLVGSDGGLGDNFGGSVSLSGSVAIVGARFDDDLNSDSGAAYVFRFDGASWLLEQKLLADDGAALDEFGASVSISGDKALVGAVLDDESRPGADVGSAYVYGFNGSSWVQEQKLLCAEGAAGDEFGMSVALSGDTAIVGAHRDDDPVQGENAGSAYIFHASCDAPPCLGDVVSSDTFQPPPDGQVDGADLAYLLGEWGANPGSSADLVTSATFEPPADGVVDGADLAVLLGAWGACN